MAAGSELATRVIASMNPATGERLQEFPCASDAEVAAAVERARAVQPAWQAAGAAFRAEVLLRFVDVLSRRKTEIARLISREAGKPYVEALLTEVLVAMDAARFAADESLVMSAPEPVPHRNPVMKMKRGSLVRQPYGVVGIISPWNYPFSIPAVEATAALAMGNTVVLKPSELTSLAALEVRSLLISAGLPDDALQVVLGDGPTGAALIASPIDKLVFTGSVPTGKRVAQAAAVRLLPVVLELGGKDAMVVLDDADLEVASSAAVWGAFVNAGQTCLSVERCYVHSSLYHRFAEVCATKTAMLKVGNGLDETTEIGPLINERQLSIVESHVHDALQLGARLLFGGARLPEKGPNFYAPTVLVDVNHPMRIMREETFGPVLPIMPFDSDDDAVRLANDSEFALAASVWTRHPGRGEALARRIRAGTVMVNDVVSCFGISEAPHGGIKSSGIGRTHGRLGLEEMSWIQYLDSDRLPGMRKVWWYGYGAEFVRQMEGFTDALFATSLPRRLRGAMRSAGSLFRKGRL